MRNPFFNLFHQKILFFLLFFYIISIPIYSQNLRPDQIYEKVLPSIMTLNVIKSDGSRWVGSAFLSIDEGIGVTAYHVIKDAINVTAKFSNGEEFDVSGIIDKDEKRDIALIRIKLFGKPLLELEKVEPIIGIVAYVVGAPMGLEFSISNGLLSQIQNTEGVKVYQFSCPASKGNSGGPLISSDGNVIGVVSFGLVNGNDLNFAIPSIYVLGLDKSLPTKPFVSLSSKSDTYNIIKVQEEQFIDEIANSLTVISDFSMACTFLREIATYNGSIASWGWEQGFNEPGYTYTTPAFFYAFKKKANNQIKNLETIQNDNQLLTKAKDNILSVLKDLNGVSDLLENALSLAKRNDGWGYEANDLLSRADAILYNSIPAKDLIPTSLLDSTNIANLLSDEIKDYMDIDRKYPRFYLGVLVFINEPTMIQLVSDNSIAKECGLLRNDILLEFNDTKVSALSQFKKYFYEFRGKEVTVTIQRDGNRKILDFEIPEELPK